MVGSDHDLDWDHGFRYPGAGAAPPPSPRRVWWRRAIARRAWIGLAVAVVGLLIWGFARSASGEENHHLHHAQYYDWFSNGGWGCCNNQDCGTLDPARVRENGNHIEVLINDDRGDQWCTVEFKHLINQGQGKRPSPDWTLDHACIIGQTFSVTACERLKCFMEKGKF